MVDLTYSQPKSLQTTVTKQTHRDALANEAELVRRVAASVRLVVDSISLIAQTPGGLVHVNPCRSLVKSIIVTELPSDTPEHPLLLALNEMNLRSSSVRTTCSFIIRCRSDRNWRGASQTFEFRPSCVRSSPPSVGYGVLEKLRRSRRRQAACGLRGRHPGEGAPGRFGPPADVRRGREPAVAAATSYSASECRVWCTPETTKEPREHEERESPRRAPLVLAV
jgi:hypothetical protein